MAPLAAAPSSGNASILTKIAALTIGAIVFIAGIKVTRVSLLTYLVSAPMKGVPEDLSAEALDFADGTRCADAQEAAAEVAYLAAERQALQGEPSLFRAAEVVERQLATGPRGLQGRFAVRTSFKLGHQVWYATWLGGWGDTTRDDVLALEDLATWAQGMGLDAGRVGLEVIAHLPPARPGLAKTRGRTAEEAA